MWVLIWVDFLGLGRAAEEKGAMRKEGGENQDEPGLDFSWQSGVLLMIRGHGSCEGQAGIPGQPGPYGAWHGALASGHVEPVLLPSACPWAPVPVGSRGRYSFRPVSHPHQSLLA